MPNKKDLNLMLHCGAQAATREEVEHALTPKGTDSWRPIPHMVMVQYLEKALRESGFEVVQDVHALAYDGLRYFGMMEIASAGDSDYSTIVGVRNANDKAFAAGAVVGSGVFVCDNLCFSGEVKFGRKHTPNILQHLPGLITESINKVTDLRVRQDSRILAYKTTQISDSLANDLIIAAMDADIVSPSKIKRILQEWREPKHEEFTEDGKSIWRLLNSFTEVLKPRASGNDLFTLPGKTETLHNILDKASGQEVDDD